MLFLHKTDMLAFVQKSAIFFPCKILDLGLFYWVLGILFKDSNLV